MQPDVSVIIPTYNRRGFLEQAVQSCFAGNDALGVEVIVVDDGSTDGTREWLRRLGDERVRPVFQEHQGAQVARNRGMSEARGAFIKFLDDDDQLAHGSLASEVQHLRQTDVDICYGHLRVQDETHSWTKWQRADPDLPSAILRGNVWTHPHGFLYRRKAVEALSWDPSFPYHQDYAFALNMACQKTTLATGVDHEVGTIRRHDGPRMDDAKSAASREEYYGLKAYLIEEGIKKLRRQGALQEQHRQAAATGLWMWAHILASYDLEGFEKLCLKIERVVPSFRPQRNRDWVSRLDAWLGYRRTEKLLYPLRRVKNATTGMLP